MIMRVFGDCAYSRPHRVAGGTTSLRVKWRRLQVQETALGIASSIRVGGGERRMPFLSGSPVHRGTTWKVRLHDTKSAQDSVGGVCRCAVTTPWIAAEDVPWF